ncbi:RNA polymerase sigma factor [Solirubrobacter soli]|uniref:RNA polymerase sigma factor n=1 Tax=Solirubrobacter soli TaxID=363832 RepID=UPI00041F4026|nr:sigma-70 family RNA polymerase sigma factor [Solirubrobacter soli]
MIATPISAEERLVTRALTIARRTALGVLGDREAAADVAQEVALTALQKADSIRDLDAWLHKVAVRRALKEARRNRDRRDAEARAHVPPRPDDPLTEALELLDGLPPRQRAALTLRYVHDLPDAAIAKALGCRTGTVRSLLSRGREALRSEL